MRKLVIAARNSLLSRAQAESVRRLLEEAGVKTEFLPTTTKGDRDRVRALRDIGGDGLFVREVEAVLLSGEADVAVHCGKDLPYRTAEGLTIAGVPTAASAGDCLVYPEGAKIRKLQKIGTGSVRRIQALRHFLPEAECAEIRGNINTRLDKLRSGEYDAIVLAKAGLERLKPDMAGLERYEFTPEEMIPAACQGILALQCREDDQEVIALLADVTDTEAKKRFQTERKLFCLMEADCATALGVHAVFEGSSLTLHAMFDSRQTKLTGSAADADLLIKRAAHEIYRK